MTTITVNDLTVGMRLTSFGTPAHLLLVGLDVVWITSPGAVRVIQFGNGDRLTLPGESRVTVAPARRQVDQDAFDHDEAMFGPQE